MKVDSDKSESENLSRSYVHSGEIDFFSLLQCEKKKHQTASEILHLLATFICDHGALRN